MREVEVVRTYLELRSLAELVPGPAPGAPQELRVERVASPTPALYRSLYQGVGGEFHWVDRRAWDDERLRAHLARPQIALYLLYRRDQPAGWFELESHHDGSIELVYFGILAAHRRLGLGRFLLNAAAREAFGAGAPCLWLHTCTLDDPAALPNYLARGFRRVREERYTAEIADPPEDPSEPLPKR